LQAFYGVFDGHGGRAAVDFVSERLSKNVVSAVLAAAATMETRGEASSEDAVSAAIKAAYLATDSELLTKHQVCTATVTPTHVRFLRLFTGSMHFPTLNASKASFVVAIDTYFF